LFFVTDYTSLLAQNVLFEFGTGATTLFKNNGQTLQSYVDSGDTGSSPGVYPASNKAVIGFVSSPTGLKFYCNGSVGSAGAMSSQSQTGGTLFQLNFTGFDLFAAGNLYEVAFYDAALSTADISALLNYFSYRHTIHTYDANRIVCLGDSITAGYASTGNRSFPARLLKLAPLGTRVYNLGVGSRTAATLDAGLPTQSAPYYSSSKPCVGVVFAGTNDLNTGASAATVLASLQSACGKLRTQGYVAAVCSTLPRGGAIGGFEAARVSLNASLAANWSTFADKFIDLAADSRLSSVNGTYYATDNLHLNNAGYVAVGDLVYAKISGYLKFPQARGGVIGSGLVGAAP
jgi:lysophospholipase L1-like esterase